MENLHIRCKNCNKEIHGNPARVISCGCSNMTTIHNNNKITALDLSLIVMLNAPNTKMKSSLFSWEDIAWQESRKKRKIRKLDFEVR